MIRDGATLGGSDWKYGLPHKFYVYRNPLGGYPKWYSEHLFDQGYNEAALQQLLDVLTCHTGIRWTVDDKGEIRYNAPYHGYQRSGYA